MEKQETTVVQSGGLGLGTLLSIIFMVLKLCHVINWSWFWVLFPLIISVGLWIIIFVVALVIVLASD